MDLSDSVSWIDFADRAFSVYVAVFLLWRVERRLHRIELALCSIAAGFREKGRRVVLRNPSFGPGRSGFRGVNKQGESG